MAEERALTTSKAGTIRDLLVKSQDQIRMALPRHMTPDKLIRVALTAMQRNPRLFDCDPKTLLGAVMQSAQLGLEPDGALGQAYLIPFKNNKRGGIYEAQFMVGYKGLIDLARRSGHVASISAHVVYEADTFEFAYGLDEKLRHVPDLTAEDRGAVVAVYAVAKLKDGSHHFEVMSRSDVDRIRKSSKAKDDGPWVTHWDEMARKTVVRRLAKYLPLSPEFQRAAAMDEQADAGVPQMLDAEVVDIEDITDPAQAATDATAADLSAKLAKAKGPAPEIVGYMVPNARPKAKAPTEEARESARAAAWVTGDWSLAGLEARINACQTQGEVRAQIKHKSWSAAVKALTPMDSETLGKIIDGRLDELAPGDKTLL